MEEWHIPSEQEQCSQDFLMLIAQLANTSKQQIVGVRRPRYEANLSCCNHWIGLRTVIGMDFWNEPHFFLFMCPQS